MISMHMRGDKGIAFISVTYNRNSDLTRVYFNVIKKFIRSLMNTEEYSKLI
jgi:hypothetical protein